MIANRAAQNGILRLQRVEHCSDRDRACDFELYFVVHAGEIAQMIGECDANHVLISRRREMYASSILNRVDNTVAHGEVFYATSSEGRRVEHLPDLQFAFVRSAKNIQVKLHEVLARLDCFFL